jgi:hypothetical protein
MAVVGQASCLFLQCTKDSSVPDSTFDSSYNGASNKSSPEQPMRNLDLDDEEHVTLCEALDRVLNKGAVVAGEVTISVANVDLIYLGLQLVITSIESARRMAADCASPLGRFAELPAKM